MKDIIKWRLINDKPKELKFKNFSDGIFHKFSGLLNFNKRKSYLRNSQTILDLEKEFFTTMNMRVEYLSPTTLGEIVTGEAKVLKKGRVRILIQVDILNEKTELVANGTISNLILHKKAEL